MKTNSFEDILLELKAIHDIKNEDYGSSFEITFKKYGLLSSLIRLSDKMLRLETLATTGKQ